MPESGILAVHSQSNRPDAPLNFTEPSEQAFDSRALTLLHADVVATSTPIEQSYLDYLRFVLRISPPKLISPPATGTSLSESIIQSQQAIDAIQQTQAVSRRQLVLSVFDPTDSEKQLLNVLQQSGIDVIPEINFDTAARLGNKAGFREFCTKYDIPQVSGGVFKTIEDLKLFIARSQNRRKGLIIKHPDPVGVVLKHPNGTAGEGINILDAGTIPTEDQLQTWEGWLQRVGSVVAEEKHTTGEGLEHALHVYINPLSKKATITGIYDQLTKRKEDGTQEHYGAKSPMKNKRVRRSLLRLANRKIIPALLKEGYTGPACFDILSGPLHFMELNARAGANYYAHREVEQVAQSVYGADPKQGAFFFLASIPTEEANFLEFYQNHADALQPRKNGTLILTNPSRHKFGKYDVIAYSPYGTTEAEKVLVEGLTKIWGPQKAAEILGKIQKREDRQVSPPSAFLNSDIGNV